MIKCVSTSWMKENHSNLKDSDIDLALAYTKTQTLSSNMYRFLDGFLLEFRNWELIKFFVTSFKLYSIN